MSRPVVVTLSVVVLTIVGAIAIGIAYGAMARHFVAGDENALAGIVRAPVREQFVIRNVSLWDGRGGGIQPARSVLIDDGRIADVLDGASPLPSNATVIDGTGRTLIPGLIDSHVHLMYDSGPDLLRRPRQLIDEWLALHARTLSRGTR